MPRVVAVGEWSRVAGFALAGVTVVVAEAPADVRTAVAALGDDVAVLLLTARAAAALDDAATPTREPPRPGRPLPVVMPA